MRAYASTGVPAAVAGARTLLVLPPRAVDLAIGVFLLAMIPARRWLMARRVRAETWHLAVAGAIIGYVTGIVVSTGPLSVPVFLIYGLTKGAFLATEAAGSLAIFTSKAIAFQRFGALTLDTLEKGLVAGASLMAGAFIAKRFVLRLDPGAFRLVMDGLMLASGLGMLWDAAWAAAR